MGDAQNSTWPIAVADAGPPLSLDNVLAAERRLREPIPLAYREFLLTYNGGRPQPARYAVPAGACRSPREARVEWFLGITGGIVADNDLEEHRDLVKPIFPNLFPIAWDSDWKLILIGLGGNWARDAV